MLFGAGLLLLAFFALLAEGLEDDAIVEQSRSKQDLWRRKERLTVKRFACSIVFGDIYIYASRSFEIRTTCTVVATADAPRMAVSTAEMTLTKMTMCHFNRS